jgi:acyl-CoA thioester hydrolase
MHAAGKLVTSRQQLTQSGNSFAGKWMEGIDITFSLAGLAPNGSRFKVQNEVCHTNGNVAARITSTGCFMDIDTRKLVEPPQAIVAA